MQDELREILNTCFEDKSNLKKAKALIEQGAEVDPTSSVPWTLFILAVNKNPDEPAELTEFKNEFAKFLINQGLSVDKAQPPEEGTHQETALHLAACAANLEVTRFLVEVKKADLNVITDENETPLEMASMILNTEDFHTAEFRTELAIVVAYLLKKQQELEKQKELNDSPRAPLASDSPLNSPRGVNKSFASPTPAELKAERMKKGRE